jgi:hypothetical protein
MWVISWTDEELLASKKGSAPLTSLDLLSDCDLAPSDSTAPIYVPRLTSCGKVRWLFPLHEETHGSRGIDPLILDPGARWVEWSTSRPVRFNSRKEHQYRMNRRFGGPRRWYGRLRERSFVPVRISLSKSPLRTTRNTYSAFSIQNWAKSCALLAMKAYGGNIKYNSTYS